ncbi:MAG: Peroxiredoxin, partial [Mucilaginibacter sp.]|nr:Peroxiredoxin [Mucilaginibacter sp.]
MKKLFPVLILFLAPIFCMAQVVPDSTTLNKTSDKAPGFEFSISKDKKANLNDYHGKIVMINFFAT